MTYTEQDVDKEQVIIGKFYENIKHYMVDLTENGTKNIFDKGHSCTGCGSTMTPQAPCTK